MEGLSALGFRISDLERPHMARSQFMHYQDMADMALSLRSRSGE